MPLNFKSLKKKLVRTYEETVRKAATKAIPVIKREATKAIAKGTDEKVDALFDILMVGAVGAAVLLAKGGGPALNAATQASTYVHIENLTINL